MDDDEAKLVLALCRVIVVGFCVVTLTIAGCNITESVETDAAISADVAHGADPQDAACGHSMNSVNAQICAAIAARKSSP